jgi:2-octaprenyl-6-methoxyphenol hydroxylase
VHDLLIVGGGPVGLFLATAAARDGLDTVVLEAEPDAAAQALDDRALALSHASWQLLDRIGAAGALAPHATAIRTVHISQRGHAGQCVLHAHDAGVDALGRVAGYAAVRAALRGAADAVADVRAAHRASAVVPAGDHVEVAVGAQRFTARCVAIADGSDTWLAALGMQVDVRDYGVHALAARVHVDAPDRGIAWERFDAPGPVALLPRGGGDHALIWTLAPDDAQAQRDAPEHVFRAALQRAFGWRAGRFVAVDARRTWPLVQVTARPIVQGRVVLVGNAAQRLHPVAGQGLNLGLRDAWSLARQLRRGHDPAEALAAHARARRVDRGITTTFTDTLATLFTHAAPGFGTARGAGLALLDTLPLLRRAVARSLAVAVR